MSENNQETDVRNAPVANTEKSNQINNSKAGIATTSDVINAENNQSGSFLNTLLWLFGLASFIFATLVNQYLPAYWQPASNIWMRIGCIVGLVVLGIVLLLLTKQGKGFSKLLSDSQVELRRVNWPGKEETIEYTWKVLLVTTLAGILIYFLDVISGILVSPFIR